jgi:hypothetical protein
MESDATTTIPDVYNDGEHGSRGLPIISVADKAFMDKGSKMSISLPETLESIGDYAFAGCHSLSSISVEEE